MVNEIELYPIVDNVNEVEIVYDKKIQKVSYIMANLVSIFENYFLSFFPDDFFKFKRIKTETDFARFKDFMKTYPKKPERPMLIINPENIEASEDSLYMNTIMNRFNTMDPKNDENSAKLMYSTTLFESDKVAVLFRKNRYKIRFDVMLVEKTLARQLDLYNHLIMNIRHQSKFTLARKMLSMIPLSHIMNIAKLHALDYKTDAFMEFLNKYSYYPIIKRIAPNNNYMFFMAQDISIYVDIPEIPSRDGVDNTGMIEGSARITDTMIFEADIPSEFIFTTPKDNVPELIYKITDPEGIFYIPPIQSDPDYPKEIGDHILANKLDVEITNIEENSLNLVEFIADTEPELAEIMEECVKNSVSLDSLIKVNVYPNGSIVEDAYTIDKGILTLNNPDFRMLYTMCIYINYKEFNKIKSSEYKKQIGTIVE